MAEKSKKYEANAQFGKLQRAHDAKKATSDYESAAVALRAKTERLKALRLARDAAAPPSRAAPKRKAKKKAASGNSIGLAGRTSQRGPAQLERAGAKPRTSQARSLALPATANR